MEGFYRKKGRARELLAKGKKGLFFRPGFLLWEDENRKGFTMWIASSSSGGWIGCTCQMTSLVLTRKFQIG